MNITTWTGCYPSNWRGIITPESMSHPAKFSSRLIERIYQHAFDCGWLREGDSIVDCFGGVALGAWPALRYGLNWTGIELESRFVQLGQDNIDLWCKKYNSMPHWGSARLIQGDSRNLVQIVGEANACISSPPYTDSAVNPGNVGNQIRYRWSRGKSVTDHNDGYGEANGQLGAMKAGDYKAAISSPPFEHQNQGGGISAGLQGRSNYPLPMAKTPGHINNGYTGQGDSIGQLGNDTGDTFWSAARTIIEQTYQVLAPGAHAIFVCKGYVKNKQLVDFPGQWREVCEAVGFLTLHEHHAMLINHRGTSYTLDGGEVEHKTESKSFFRRLAEKKGSPHIDFETVLCMLKTS